MYRFVEVWLRTTEKFIPPELDADTRRRAQVGLALFGIGVVIAAAFGVINLIHGAILAAIAPLAIMIVVITLPFVMRRTGSMVLLGNAAAGLWFLGLLPATYMPDAIGLPVLMATAATAMIAMFIAGWSSAVVWALVSAGNIVVFGVLEGAGYRFPDTPDVPRHPIIFVGPILFVGALLALAGAYERVTRLTIAEREESDEARMRAEREKARAEEEAKLLRADRMASVGQLAAGVAHEINNPLAYVIANIDFLQRELDARERAGQAPPRDTVDALAEAREGAERVKSIVGDLRTFARVDDEKVRRVDVVEVIESSLKIAGTEIRHRARVERDFDSVPPVSADASRLVQVFLNVLVNAAHAISEGHADGNEIRVAVRRDGAHVVAEVADTGAGIPERDLARVKEPFFTTKPVGLGTGLGLSVCTNIVETYGGQLDISSRVGEGTVVTIRLPAAQGADADSVVPSARVSDLDANGALKVLVVDDDPLVLRSVARTLRDHDVTKVDSGRLAIDLLCNGGGFDVVFCDLMMPDLTGMDVYEEIKRTRPGTEERIVFLTGGAFTERARAFLESVPNIRLHKPFEPDRLRELVRAMTKA